MKQLLAFLTVLLLASCGNAAVEKPDNLIDEKKMKDIMYDLALLEAIQSQKPVELDARGINPNTYIYKKYEIDSLQFVKSNRYYASDVNRYKQMYDAVAKRLEKNKAEIDSLMQANGAKPQPETPDAGVVR